MQSLLTLADDFSFPHHTFVCLALCLRGPMDTLSSVGLRHQLLYIFSVVRIRNSAQEEIRA